MLSIVSWIVLVAFVAADKLETCDLHPKIEERIVKDTAAWGDAGITEDLVKSVSKHCDTEARIRQHYCNCQPQRILIENGEARAHSSMQVDGGSGRVCTEVACEGGGGLRENVVPVAWRKGGAELKCRGCRGLLGW